jgi:hypothetical protein
MTFRLQRSTVDDATVLMLSGDIAGDHTADLETLVDADGTAPMVLDLRDVSVVDRAGVLLLARSEARGASIDPRESVGLLRRLSRRKSQCVCAYLWVRT